MSVQELACETVCAGCGASRCAHDDVLARLLGCESSELCLGCLSFAFGVEPGRFARGAVAHLQKKSCLWLAFERVCGCGCVLERAKRDWEVASGKWEIAARVEFPECASSDAVTKNS